MLNITLTAGLRSALINLKREITFAFRHHKGILKARKYQNQNQLNLILDVEKGWVNIDLNSSSDLTLDVRELTILAALSIRNIFLSIWNIQAMLMLSLKSVIAF